MTEPLNEDYRGRTVASRNRGTFMAVIALTVLMIISLICGYLIIRGQIDSYNAQALFTKCHNIGLQIAANKHPATPTEHNLAQVYPIEYQEYACKAVLSK